jgi:hypothetical protein
VAASEKQAFPMLARAVDFYPRMNRMNANKNSGVGRAHFFALKSKHDVGREAQPTAPETGALPETNRSKDGFGEPRPTFDALGFSYTLSSKAIQLFE